MIESLFARRGAGLFVRGLTRLSATAVLLLGLAAGAGAQQLFQTPDAAVSALAAAAASGDVRAIMRVLGPEGAEIASSGDPVADGATRKRFAEAYEAKHQVVLDGDNKATLVVGQQDWPFPIPLVLKNEAWRFDTTAGREEILFRRIGRNELSAIQTCLAYVDAQQEYAEKDRSGTGMAYAQRIVSRPGKKDGLYWPPQAGEDESPVGEFIARAAAEGYRAGQGPNPFHGYYYKILTRQGPKAPGGAMDYIVRGNMIGGFALVAYPAEYENSGVMTFLVNQDGIVFEKDLGRNTARTAAGMTAFNPDSTWRKVANNGIPEARAKQ